MNDTSAAKGRRSPRRWYRYRYLYAMALPAVVLVFLFNYVVLAGWIIAFKNYRAGMTLWSAKWVGLKNFNDFFLRSDDYIFLLRNTLVMNLGALFVGLFSAFVFAILLNEIRHRFFAKLVQTTTFFPFFISWVIIYAFMNSLFAPSTGAVNELLAGWGWISDPINLLGDKKFSWTLMIGLETWKGLGYNSVIFLAAIAGIPAEQYEAAEVDGAGRFWKIVHVTVPNMMPTLVVLLILNSGWILNSNFDQYFLFTNATNWESMQVLEMYIYRYGLQLLNYPFATAVGIMKSVVSILLVIGVNALSKRVNGQSIL
ncbi:MAG: sugar ABC transporter permease [Paenibacillaceae bacterium]|nr:sugar ABC transporter permease [Paenibacillaceae bacterium]